jgi:O-antigen/teichoic acid export membrane protein
VPAADEHSQQDALASGVAGPAAVRGGILRVGGYAVGTVFGVLSAALLLRHLGVDDAGRYYTALALVAIVAAFSDLGLTAVGMRELSIRQPAERESLMRDLLGLRLLLTVLGSLIAIAIAWAEYSPELAVGVALACLGLLLQVTQDNFSLPLLVELRLGWVSALELARQLLTTLLIVSLVLAGASVVPFLAIPIPVGGMLLVAVVALVRRRRALRPAFSTRRWRSFMAAMVPYSAATAASVLYFRVSILLVSTLSTGAQLGYFGASFRIIEVLMVVPILLVGSAFPIFARAARDDHDRLGYALGRMFEVSLVIGVGSTVAIAVGAPVAIAVVGGSTFAPAAPVLAIQGVALGAIFMTQTWSNALLGLGVYRTILILSVGALILNTAMVSVLVPLYGAEGAAVGTAIAEVTLAVAQGLAVVRGRPALKPPVRIVPWVVVAALLGLTPLLITGIPDFARLVIAVVIYGAVVVAARAYPPELPGLLRRQARQNPGER